MTVAFSTTDRIRVSKKALKELAQVNPLLAETLSSLANRYEFKSFRFDQKPEGQAFYAGEDQRFTFVYGENVRGIEVVANHNIGASDVSYAIGTEFFPPRGTFVFTISYHGQFFCQITNVVERALPAPKAE